MYKYVWNVVDMFFSSPRTKHNSVSNMPCHAARQGFPLSLQTMPIRTSSSHFHNEALFLAGKTSHLSDGRKSVFRCPLCPQMFTTNKMFKNHTYNVHGMSARSRHSNYFYVYSFPSGSWSQFNWPFAVIEMTNRVWCFASPSKTMHAHFFPSFSYSVHVTN